MFSLIYISINIIECCAPAYETIRSVCKALHKDRPLYEDINHCEDVLKDGSLLKAVEDAVGELK